MERGEGEAVEWGEAYIGKTQGLWSYIWVNDHFFQPKENWHSNYFIDFKHRYMGKITIPGVFNLMIVSS